MKKILVMAAMVAAMMVGSAQANIVVTQWNFEGDTLTPSTGSGTAANVGGTSSAFAGGNGGGRGWNTSSYAAQGTASGTAGVQFFTSTVGFTDVKLSFDHRASGTASRWAQVNYTLDGGTSWTEGFWNNSGGLSPHDTFYSFEVDFSSVAGANNNANFGVQIVSIFSPVAFSDGLGNDFDPDLAYHRARVSGGSVYGTAGTWRFDNVTFSAVPEPSALLLVGSVLGFGALRRRRA